MYEKSHKNVATWIPIKDFELLQELANKHKVRLAAYLRAIIVDALQDEQQVSSTIQPVISRTQPRHEVV